MSWLGLSGTGCHGWDCQGLVVMAGIARGWVVMDGIIRGLGCHGWDCQGLGCHGWNYQGLDCLGLDCQGLVFWTGTYINHYVIILRYPLDI